MDVASQLSTHFERRIRYDIQEIGIAVLFIGMIGVYVPGWAEDEGPKQLTVKGLYVGMGIKEAKNICRQFLCVFGTSIKN